VRQIERSFSSARFQRPFLMSGMFDNTEERAAEQINAARETVELRAAEDGVFHVDADNIVNFDLTNLDFTSSDTLGRRRRASDADQVVKGYFKTHIGNRNVDMSIAIKIMRVFENQSENNRGKGFKERDNEVAIHRRSTHPNVVTLYGFIEREFRFYMCMELMDADLAQITKLIHEAPSEKKVGKAQIESFIGCVVVSVRSINYSH
ncbi:hypothetical protein PMAYCL1PPCAC_20118, partial [Pristionchus mayeri]